MPQLNFIQGITALFNFIITNILIMKLISLKLEINTPKKKKKNKLNDTSNRPI